MGLAAAPAVGGAHRGAGGDAQTEIAQRLGISQIHVSRLLGATLRELRTRLLDAEG